MNNNSSSCVPLAWSADDADAVGPSLYVCIIALVFHTIFWLTTFFYSSLRQWKSMQWLYAFLVIDLLLLVRFYILYGLRTSFACVTPTVRSSVCYFESVGDIYLNCLQGYVLLALNICRHIQITRGGADVYSTYRCRMFIMHCLIYLIPLFIIIIEIKSGWAVVYYRPGGSCDLDFPLLLTRLLNLIFVHCIPVFLTLLFLCLSLRHVRLTVASMNTQQIIDVRRKHHRFLVFQSFVFYSVWLDETKRIL